MDVLKVLYGCCTLAVMSFAFGLGLVIINGIKWTDAVDYEEGSLIAQCTLLEVVAVDSCQRKNGLVFKWKYTVMSPFCEDVVLVSIDKDCTSSSPYTNVNSTRECRVRRDCSSFDWERRSEVYMAYTFVGAGLILSCFIYTGVLCYCLEESTEAETKTSPENNKKPVEKSNPKEVVTIDASPDCDSDSSESVTTFHTAKSEGV
eukprot:TRINITY_DN22505_c0_g1_i1.p1 TRINITY_DN22505_c0_g1~~TRINITY_DN22505_c0_g1_i1.p1  ORF type:complete len:203 (+),score=14.98 TRINITY_DN22505_c0_g1_i1:53-661(+)